MTVPSRADLLDERDAALEEVERLRAALAAADARPEVADSDARALAAEDRAQAAHARAEQAAATASAAVEEATNQLVDVYVVLARWGVNIDRGEIGALVEYALREAEAMPCQPRLCAA